MSHGSQFSEATIPLQRASHNGISNTLPAEASACYGGGEAQSTRRRTRAAYEVSDEDGFVPPTKKRRVTLGPSDVSTTNGRHLSLQDHPLNSPSGQPALAPSFTFLGADLPSSRVLLDEMDVLSVEASQFSSHFGLSTTDSSPRLSPSLPSTPTLHFVPQPERWRTQLPGVIGDFESPKLSDSRALNMQDTAENPFNASPSNTEVVEDISLNSEENSLSQFGSALLGRFGIQPERGVSCLPRAEARVLLGRIYVHLQNHSPGSGEYLQILRLLQECSLYCRALPTSLVVKSLAFDRQDIIGQGNKTIVYRGKMVDQEVVVREIRVDSGYDQEPVGPKIIQLVNREIITRSQLHHPNILPFLGVYVEEVDVPPLLVLPFLERGSLRNLLAELKPGQLVKVPDLICLLLGASRGVMYLHSQNPPIVHGRLHPGNILIDNSGRPLLCDFGFDRMSHRVTLAPTLPRNGDKIRFLDPEAHTSLGFTSSLGQESDIFGLAMIFLNVWSGQLPFSEIKDERKVELRYILGRRPAKPVIAVDLRPEIRDTFWELLVAMWTHDMAMRPRIGHVLEQLERIFDGSPDITALFTSFPVLSCDLTACRPPVASKSSILRPHLHTQSTSTSGRELSKFTSTAPASTSSHILPRTPHSHEYDVIVMVSSWDLSIWIPVNIGSPLTGKSIRKLIYTAVDIHDDHCRLTSLRRVYASSGRTSDALSDYALLEICLNMGDSEGTLEFHVSREIPSTFLENPVSLEDKTARNAAPRPAPLPVRKAGDQGEGDGPKTYHSTDALLRTAFPLGSPTAMTISICQIGSPKLFGVEYFALFAIDFVNTRIWVTTRRSFSQNKAIDTVSISKMESELWQAGQKMLMSCTYRPMQLLPLPRLADILPLLNQGVLEKGPLPNPKSCELDSWWYVVALLGALRPYRTNWTKVPALKWAAKAVETLSKPIPRLLAEAVARKALPVPIYSLVSISRCLLLSDWTVLPASRKGSWLSSELAVEQDAVHAVLRLLSEPYPDGIMMKEANQEHALELLQEALNDPSDALGVNRPRALRMLQDLVSRSEKVPPSVKNLAVRDRVFLDVGGEAVIWRVKLDAGGEIVIAREARRPENGNWTSPEGKARLSLVRREIISQIHVQHPNIVPILGISSDETHPLSIITPLAQNGNAFHYLTSLAARDMSQKTTAMLQIVSQVASALEYLHNVDPQIIHGDLHGRNILVDAEGNGLLSDFGLSRFKHEDTRTATNIVEGGKFRYIAPELFAPSLTQFRTTVQSDCYAFAMTILELATLQRPFAEFDNERKAFTAAERGARPQRPPLAKLGMQSEELADRLWSLLGDMWLQAHLKRPNMYLVNARLVDILCKTLSDR